METKIYLVFVLLWHRKSITNISCPDFLLLGPGVTCFPVQDCEGLNQWWFLYPRATTSLSSLGGDGGLLVLTSTSQSRVLLMVLQGLDSVQQHSLSYPACCQGNASSLFDKEQSKSLQLQPVHLESFLKNPCCSSPFLPFCKVSLSCLPAQSHCCHSSVVQHCFDTA